MFSEVVFFYSVCWSDFVLAHKSCSHHKAGSSAGNSTDNAEGASLRDGMINVSALTTCSAQFGPLFISHIPDSSVQNTHWCQPLLAWEGRLRWWEEGGCSQSTSVNLSIIGAPHAKTLLIIKTRRNTQTRGCEVYTRVFASGLEMTSYLLDCTVYSLIFFPRSNKRTKKHSINKKFIKSVLPEDRRRSWRGHMPLKQEQASPERLRCIGGAREHWGFKNPVMRNTEKLNTKDRRNMEKMIKQIQLWH